MAKDVNPELKRICFLFLHTVPAYLFVYASQEPSCTSPPTEL